MGPLKKSKKKKLLSSSNQIKNQPQITSFFTKIDPAQPLPTKKSSNKSNPFSKAKEQYEAKKNQRRSMLKTSKSSDNASVEEITLSSDSDGNANVNPSKKDILQGPDKRKFNGKSNGITLSKKRSKNGISLIAELIDESSDSDESAKHNEKAVTFNDNEETIKTLVEVQRKESDDEILESTPASNFNFGPKTGNKALENYSTPLSSISGETKGRNLSSSFHLCPEETMEEEDCEELSKDDDPGEKQHAKLETDNQDVQPILPDDISETVSKIMSSRNEENSSRIFHDANTQLIDDKNEFSDLSEIDEDEMVHAILSSPVPNRSPTKVVNMILSPKKVTEDTIMKTPTKISPKGKVTHFSPLRHIRKDSFNRNLFTSPNKSISSPKSYSSVSNSGSSSLSSPRKGNLDATSTSKAPLITSKQDTARKHASFEDFCSILTTVMSENETLQILNEDDFQFFTKFDSLTDSAKSLYIRIFQRTVLWYRECKLKYPEISKDLGPFCNELELDGFFTEVKGSKPVPNTSTLIELLDKEEVLEIGAKLKVRNSKQLSKEACISELIQSVKKQRTLSSQSPESILRKLALDKLGKTYRISEESQKFFSCIFILYSLPQYWDDETKVGKTQLLTTLLNKLGIMEYPNYQIRKSKRIFRNRDDLLRFSEALTIHSQVQANLEAKNWEDVVVLMEKAYEELTSKILADSEICSHDKSLPTFLRVYTAGSVLTRTIWIGIEALQRLKKYEEANDKIDFLLNLKEVPYVAHYRGRWHERKVVNSKHLKCSEAQQKQTIIQALWDQFINDNHRYGFSMKLQQILKREASTAMKLKKKRKKSKRKRRKVIVSDSSEEDDASDPEDTTSKEDEDPFKAFSHLTYTLKNEIPVNEINAEQFVVRGVDERVYGKSTFLGGNETGGKSMSSVEIRALSYYIKNRNYKWGVHGEGTVPISLYGLLFWDIIYNHELHVEDVFRCKFQPFPLDLYFEDFYPQRKELIDKRLENLLDGKWSMLKVLDIMEYHWVSNMNKLCIVNWKAFESLAHMKSLVKAMKLPVLAGICERLAKNFHHFKSGFPDLVVWNEHECLFSEVKGPNDQLSNKQSVWLDYLITVGAKAEVCRVKAVSNKRIQSSNSKTNDPDENEGN